MAQDIKPAGQAAANVKVYFHFTPIEEEKTSDNQQPCCVCKDEKASRDECMLFTNAKDPQKECASMIDKYKSCMAGYGFQLP